MKTLLILMLSLPVYAVTADQFVGIGSTTNAVDLGTSEVSGTLPASSVGVGITDVQVVDALTVSGGNVDNTPVGFYTPSTGAFTTGSFTGLVSIAASTASKAGVNIQLGENPTFPNAGDFWAKTDGFYGCVVAGTAIGPFMTSTTTISLDDNVNLRFGDSVAYQWRYDGTDLQLRDGGGNELGTWNDEGTTGVLAVTGDVVVGDDLAVNGNALTSDDATFGLLDVTPTLINFGGNASVNVGKTGLFTTVIGKLNVDEATTLDTTLGVTGATLLSSTLGVAGAVTLDTTLGVTGDTTLTGDLEIVGGDVTSLATTTVNVFDTNATKLNIGGEAAVDIGASGLDLAVKGTLSVAESAVFTSTFGVTGYQWSANGGDIILTDGTNTMLSVSDAGTTGDLTVTGELAADGTSITTDATTFALLDVVPTTVNFAGNAAVNIGKTGLATTIIGTANFDEAATFDTTVGIAGAVTLDTTLGVTGVLTASNASNVIRIGTSSDLTTPPAIGGTTPADGTFADLEATGILTIPVTTGATVGVLYAGSDRLLHTYGDGGATDYNIFLGKNSGNFTLTATSAAGFGEDTLKSLTSAVGTSAFGYQALTSLTSGNGNSAFGRWSQANNTVGTKNISVGQSSLYALTDGDNCVGIGVSAGVAITSGNGIVAIGQDSGSVPNGNAANATTIGDYLTFIGFQSGQSVASGSNLQNAIAIGKNAIVGASDTMALGGTGTNAVDVAISSTVADRKLYINTEAATNGIRIAYNDANGTATTYSDILLDSGGDLTIDATGGNLTLDVAAIDFSGTLRADTARYIRLTHLGALVDSGGVPTWTAASANTIAGWKLDANTEILATNVDVHSDWDAASDLKVLITFALLAAGNPGDTVEIDMACHYIGVGETGGGAALDTQTITPSVVTDGTQYKVYEAEFTINYDLADNVVEVGDTISLTFNLNTTLSEIDDILIMYGDFYYNRTRVGMELGDI